MACNNVIPNTDLGFGHFMIVKPLYREHFSENGRIYEWQIGFIDLI